MLKYIGANQKGKYEDKSSNLSKFLAKTKSREAANKTSSRTTSTGTLLNLNRNLTLLGKEQGRSLHPGRITPCLAQALPGRTWAGGGSQADHAAQGAPAAKQAYWVPSGVAAAG